MDVNSAMYAKQNNTLNVTDDVEALLQTSASEAASDKTFRFCSNNRSHDMTPECLMQDMCSFIYRKEDSFHFISLVNMTTDKFLCGTVY